MLTRGRPWRRFAAPWLVAAWPALAAAQSGVAGSTPAGAASGAGAAVLPGEATRGRAIVASRQQGLCLLCHSAPIPEERFQGNLAPDLAGIGRRMDVALLRERVLDPARFNPQTLMPSYGRIDGLTRVAPAQRGKPLLDPQQIEDVVAYLASLRD